MTDRSPGIAVAVDQNMTKGSGKTEARDGTGSARKAPAELQEVRAGIYVCRTRHYHTA